MMAGPMQRAPSPWAALHIPLGPAAAVLAAMLFAALAAHALTPQRAGPLATPDMAAAVPQRFADWKEIPSPYVQAALAAPNRETPTRDRPYDAILMRGYGGGDGTRIMLALAYAGEQRQDVKIHRPEVCYRAQGFELLRQRAVVLDIVGLPIAGTQLLVRNRHRLEAVSYWIRIGDAFPRGVWAMRAQIFRDGIAGRISDGILVRASSVIDDESQAAAAYAQQQRFLSDLVPAVAAQAPGLLAPPRAG